MGWEEAQKQALECMIDVDRGHVGGSEPGVEIAYLDWGGKGDVVSFHHANGFCAASFAAVAARLRGFCRVVAFDARGHGESTSVVPGPRGEGYSWSTLAADYASALSNWLAKSGADRVRLGVGNSFGGTLTLGAAHAIPGVFEETLLLDPVILARALLEKEAAGGVENPLAAGARRRRARFASRASAFDHFAGRGFFAAFPPESLALYVEEGFRETDDGEIELKCAGSVEAAVFEQGGSLDLRPLVPSIEATTHFIHAARGNFDRAVYDDLAERMPRATVETLDVGHLVPMEEPQRVADRILEILS